MSIAESVSLLCDQVIRHSISPLWFSLTSTSGPELAMLAEGTTPLMLSSSTTSTWRRSWVSILCLGVLGSSGRYSCFVKSRRDTYLCDMTTQKGCFLCCPKVGCILVIYRDDVRHSSLRLSSPYPTRRTPHIPQSKSVATYYSCTKPSRYVEYASKSPVLISRSESAKATHPNPPKPWSSSMS